MSGGTEARRSRPLAPSWFVLGRSSAWLVLAAGRDVADAVALVLVDPEPLPAVVLALVFRAREDLCARDDVEVASTAAAGAGRAEDNGRRVRGEVWVNLAVGAVDGHAEVDGR